MKRDLTVVGAPLISLQKAALSPTDVSLNTLPVSTTPISVSPSVLTPAPTTTEVISPNNALPPPPVVTNWFSTPLIGPVTNGEAAIGAGLFVAILIGVAVSR